MVSRARGSLRLFLGAREHSDATIVLVEGWCMRVLSYLVLFLAGCLQSGDIACSDGHVCPASYTCSPRGCLSPEQVESCDGMAEEAACSTQLGPGQCVAGGCLVPVCGNGEIEPGEACDDGNRLGGDGCSGSCSSTETCGNGVFELDEECDCGDAEHPGGTRCMDTLNGGPICSDTCTLRRCGDGTTDPDEVCDDGNNASGDGCNFDCSSDESCQNGTLDFFAAEQCDDGNNRNRDGCSSTCVIEPLAWQQVMQEQSPSPRERPAMAYDSARGVHVVFGGGDDGNLASGETWEQRSTTWSRRSPLVSPPVRRGAALAYDSKRGRMVMFGGTSTNRLDDTWEYDGTTWREVVPPSRPPARSGHAMAYDAARDRTVVFGGVQDGGRIADTWEYDGTTWTEVAAGGPPRELPAMAYDPAHGRVVLFGGFDGALKDDVWELSGGTWTLRTTTGGPPSARLGASLVYDAKRARLVLFGGADFVDDGADDGYLNDTWALTDGAWTLLTPGPTDPPERATHAATYDLARDRVVVFGGSKFDPMSGVGQYYGDTWEYDGAAWAAVTAGAVPAPRSAHAATFDLARGQLVLFGGRTASYSSEVWTYDGSWRPLPTNTGPTMRGGHAMAYDPMRRKVVLFGGDAVGPGITDETWELDGSTWTLLPATTKPAPRTGAAMVFDVTRGRVVMFGGFDGAGTYFGDTWELDAANMTWVAVTSATSPSARTNAGIAYDAARRAVVLFGGEGADGAFLGDTWMYANGSWTLLATTGAAPPARRIPQVVYDASRDRIVMFGGDAQDGTLLNDLWQLEGTAWVAYDVGPFAQRPAGAGLTVFAFDPVRQVSVLAGQTTAVLGGATAFDTWELAGVPLIAGEVCTASRDLDDDGEGGCADDECWGVCAPLCPPAADPATCPSAPSCGDGVCDDVETCRACPADCVAGTACPIVCGDGSCDATESLANCPGDCTP
jgi:cysteine-rich repeat protein